MAGDDAILRRTEEWVMSVLRAMGREEQAADLLWVREAAERALAALPLLDEREAGDGG